VTGVDFSPAMLAFANARVPNAVFIRADAQELPFDNEEFDIIVSNLGVCHVPDQPRALLEARRVLGRGGRFAMTVWCGPDVSPCFEIVYDAIKARISPLAQRNCAQWPVPQAALRAETKISHR
jgi:ubiquinone/menaquinone biosynthesis C-methylase UbiE